MAPKSKAKPGSRTDRMAAAGLALYQDPKMSQAKALTDAGYAPSTAACPGRTGLTAECCIAEARAQGLVPSSAKVTARADRVLNGKLRLLEEYPEDLRAAKASEIARIVEVTHKCHGETKAEPRADARSFAERLEWLQALAAEIKSRGLDVPRSAVLDADVVEEGPQTTELTAT